MRNASVILSLTLIATLLAGCKVRDEIREYRSVRVPTAEVIAVRVAERTSEGARMEIHVRLDNPNDVALPLTGARYSVNVAGGGSIAASARPNKTLPAAGSQVVVLPIALPQAAAGASVRVAGDITYRPPGEIRQLLTESNVPLPYASFSNQGAVE